MTLKAGTRIKNYEIRSLLGVGGMGEVYLAHDLTLGRDVAIKFLKQTEDREKLARFRREAKIISSLNHPNIVTIFEVGKHDDRHYIVTELVRGEVLRSIIAEKALSISEILDIGIQIGNALTAAHEAKIIHRDIKPENIMILPDGYVKVLDFGLAKLSEAEESVNVSETDATNTLIQTRSGMILGTVSYMSPEQLRGKNVDERTDIWSLGVCLYEMILRRRPFDGESASDVIAAVMSQTPPPLSEGGFDISPEVEEIINRALAKNKDERYPTAKELNADLKEARLMNTTSRIPVFIDDKAKTKMLLTKIHTPQPTAAHVEPEKKPRKNYAVYAAALVILAALGGYFLYQYLFASKADTNPDIKIRGLSTSGNISNAAISPDGRLIAYVNNENGRESLQLRETEGTEEKLLIAPSDSKYRGLTFSPDGDFVYYTLFKEAIGTLYRIRFFGGSPQEIVKNVDSPVAVSHDGKQLAFIRSVPQELVDRIILVSENGRNERILAEKKRPEFFLTGSAGESLAFSPDGKRIAVPLGRTDANDDSMTVAAIDVERGEIKEITTQRWYRVGRIVWKSKTNELLITAAEIGSDLFQIFKFSAADGKIKKVAPNVDNYCNLSLDKEGTRLLGLTCEKNAQLFIAASDKPTRITQITSGSGGGAEGVAWTKDGRIIFNSMQSNNRDIWIIGADGKNSRQLTFDKSPDEHASVSEDGKMVFVSSRTGTPHIWQMSIEGGGAQQLTSKGGESFPQITPDGKTVVFTAWGEANKVLWKTAADGGEAVQLTKSPTVRTLASWAAVSPDGKMVACLSKDNVEASIKLSVVSIDDGQFLNTFALPFGAASPDRTPVLRWTADGKTITYIVTNNDVSNIWQQPVAGGESKQITDFPTEQIFSFDWSKDGKQIVYSRGVVRNNLVLIEDF